MILVFGTLLGVGIRLYKIAENKNSKVAKVLCVSDLSTSFSWSWRRLLFAWEEETLQELIMLLHLARMDTSSPDLWFWKPIGGASFSVASAYQLLLNLCYEISYDDSVESWATNFWKSLVPSKILVFAWRLLQDHLPTYQELCERGIQLVPLGQCCVFCRNDEESYNHLFFLCPLTKRIWYVVMGWLGISFASK